MAFKHAFDVLLQLFFQSAWAIVGTLVLARKSLGVAQGSKIGDSSYLVGFPAMTDDGLAAD